VRLDRKLLLIAPTIVLACVVAGMIYAAAQLNVLGSVSGSWKDRNDFITAVEHGQKPLNERQAMNILRFSLDVEERRTAAITAIRDLIAWLSGMAAVACVVLVIGVRSVPREHWPRFSFGKEADA
jgi:hypothetical protein